MAPRVDPPRSLGRGYARTNMHESGQETARRGEGDSASRIVTEATRFGDWDLSRLTAVGASQACPARQLQILYHIHRVQSTSTQPLHKLLTVPDARYINSNIPQLHTLPQSLSPRDPTTYDPPTPPPTMEERKAEIAIKRQRLAEIKRRNAERLQQSTTRRGADVGEGSASSVVRPASFPAANCPAYPDRSRRRRAARTTTARASTTSCATSSATVRRPPAPARTRPSAAAAGPTLCSLRAPKASATPRSSRPPWFMRTPESSRLSCRVLMGNPKSPCRVDQQQLADNLGRAHHHPLRCAALARPFL